MLNKMNPHTYRQLEAVFSKLNEAQVEFYSSLCDIYPAHKRTDLLEALRLTLKNTGEVYRLVTDKLFEAHKE